MCFSHELFLYGLWVFYIFCVSWSCILQSPLWHHWKTQQSPVPGHLQHLLSACAVSGAPGPQCSSGVPGVTIVQIFHFLQFLCNATSFQQNLEALQPLPSRSGRTFSKLTLPLILSLRFLAEVGNKDVTDSGGLVRDWVTSQPQSTDGGKKKVIYKASGLTLQKTLYKP